jgi:hypothetical protein
VNVIATIDPQMKTISITMPLQTARPSRSTGKTLVIATTHGCQVTDARRFGRPVVVTANAFVYANKLEKVDSAKTQPPRPPKKRKTVRGTPTGTRSAPPMASRKAVPQAL